MVRLGRFELSTSCFGGTRSIQLSYSRVVPLYHVLPIVRTLHTAAEAAFAIARRAEAVANIVKSVLRSFYHDFTWTAPAGGPIIPFVWGQTVSDF